MARTNFIAQRLAQRISAHNIPWVYVDGRNNQWAAPVRNAAAEALHHLQRGAPIDINEWKAILNVVSGRELFVRGTKKQWENRSDFNGDRFALMDINGLDQWGATDAFKRLVLSGRWMDKVEHAREYLAAKEKYGWETVTNPKVRIGTIHSAKGMEADNVVIMRTITQQVAMGREIEEIADEEHRLAYVAVTRARRRVIILTERNKPFHMEV